MSIKELNLSPPERLMFRRLVAKLTTANVWSRGVKLNEWEVDGVKRVLEAVGLDRQ